MHKGSEVLKEALHQAAALVEIDGIYAHYKHPDQHYKVLRLAIIEADDAICVLYQAQYDPELVFVRPLDSWLGRVAWEGQEVERFTKVTTP